VNPTVDVEAYKNEFPLKTLKTLLLQLRDNKYATDVFVQYIVEVSSHVIEDIESKNDTIEDYYCMFAIPFLFYCAVLYSRQTEDIGEDKVSKKKLHSFFSNR